MGIPINYFDLITSFPNLFTNENALFSIITDPESISLWEKNKIIDLNKKEQPLDWAKIGIILNDPYIIILRDLVKFPNGENKGYFRVLNRSDLLGGQGVVILPEMDNKFLLLHQYRHPNRSWNYEIPRGFGEPGIKSWDQAKNEISEEIGGQINELIDLGSYYSNTGLEGNKVNLYLAKLNVVNQPEIEEGIESFSWFTLVELETMIANATITDGFTIAAYTRAKLLGLLNS